MDGIMQSKLFATRQGTILLGVIAAVIAAIALIVYLNNYRDSVNSSAVTPVLVAKGFIEKGTSGDVIKATDLYTISHLPKSSLQTGAFVDPSALTDKVVIASEGIGQGQQLTDADFGPATGALTEQLAPTERAVSVPLGAPQQVGNEIGAGSHVDVWLTINQNNKPVTLLLLQDAYVLGSSGGNATLRTTPRQAGQIIWGSSNGQLWLALRPTVGKSLNQPPVIGSLKAGG